MTDMTDTIEKQQLIADELEDIVLVFSMLEKNNLTQSLQTVEKGLERIDAISQEHDAVALRVISHWMGMNLELNDDTHEQITTLLREDHFSIWIDILASVLRHYDPVLLPQLHQSLTSPAWPIKPSAPLLKSIAVWIEEGRTPSQDVDEKSQLEAETSTDVLTETSKKQPTKETKDESSDDVFIDTEEEEFLQKHVFEEVDLSILHKNYNHNTAAILKELKEHPDFKVSLIEIDKTGLSDTPPINENNSVPESDNNDEMDFPDFDDNDRSDFALEVDDIVMNLSASSSTSTKPLEDIDSYLKELSRLTQLAEISNYEGVSNASNWCQRNIRLFKENQNGINEHFVKSGECWSWIELLNISMSDPDETIHLNNLTKELNRKEWLESFEEEDLERLLIDINQNTEDHTHQYDLNNDFDQTLNSNDNNDFNSLQTNNDLEFPLLEIPELLDSAVVTDLVSEIPLFDDNADDGSGKSYETSGLETSWNDDIHPELLSVYLAETPDQITKLTPLLSAINENKADNDEKYTAARLAHTIKGGSAVVGISALSEYAHRLETLLDFSVEHPLPDELLSILPNAANCLERLFDAIQSKQNEPQEFLGIYNKLSYFVDHLEDYQTVGDTSQQDISNQEEELEALNINDLPDFIQSQNSLNDSLETEIFKGLADESEEALEDAILKNEQAFFEESTNANNQEDATSNYEIITSAAHSLEEIRLPDEIPNALEKIDNFVDDKQNNDFANLDHFDIADDSNDITVEIDDIVMTLASITANSEDVFQNIEKYNLELDRFEMLAEISGYPELAKLSQWCQSNLFEFTNIQTESSEQFISTGECWAWLEHLGICLNDPEDPSNLSFLTAELIREEWTETLDINELQNVLLAIRKEASIDDSIDDASSDGSSKDSYKDSANDDINNPEEDGYNLNSDTNTDITSNIEPIENTLQFTTDNNEITANQLPKVDDVSDLENPNPFEDSTQENINSDNSDNSNSSDNKQSEEVISWDSDIHPELLSTYFQETPDQVAEVAGLLHKISNNKASKDDYKKASRIAHTIKGASGIVGLTSLVDLTHRLEDILDFSVNNELPKDTADFLADTSDCLESLFETIQQKRQAPEELSFVLDKLTNFTEELDALENSSTDTSSSDDLEFDSPELPDFIESVSDSMSNTVSNTVANTLSTPSATSNSGNTVDTNLSVSETHIRVPVDIIDKLLNLAGELVTTSTKVSDQLKQTEITNKDIQTQDTHVHKMLNELNDTIYQQEKDQHKMLSSLQESDFDSLEMDTYNELHSVVGLLTESILDSETIENNLSKQLRDIQEDLQSLDKLNKELSDVILSSRMVSLNTLIPRLERIVRETCRKTGKKAELIVTGNDINIDTDILNGLVDPLLHLLRNAIDHGIESPEERATKNKDEVGFIQLDFSREGNHILMQLQDDGAGIDPEFIYQRAIDKAIITPDQEFSPAETLKLILHPGFSTQESVSEVSGRGVGMDVVNTSVENLKGELQINSEMNQGTRFNVRIPLTLITNTTLLVKASDNPVAIASENIDQILYLAPERVIEKKGKHYVSHNDTELLIHSLSELLDWSDEAIDFSKPHTLLLIKTGDHLQAVQIEEIIYSREVVVKNLEPWVNARKGITGACHLNDGGVAPVINLVTILKNAATETSTKKTHKVKTKQPEAEIKAAQKILVVDDSMSNRKALSLIIEQTEYEVLTAVDGLDALQVMNDNDIDMVFTDLEMPRMNGLEFTQAVRAWNDKRDTPVIMITSRTTAKHRNLAAKAGVDDYLTKPVVTETLLESMNTWLKQKEATE
ncbi:Hpt domain-containing protein [Cocleimonas sp. KMM 6892]|uniref:Hpt domain-containing protein n=1 Tax=unclassified Cocleimonas TaxID=2639732 RepID=UPI002DBCECF9|nr:MULTISPECIES: Hpt domain-containing protein [unclassified Cocleimonas]MEB8433719.1 Hpt domain-containing protein [Cocleimonas sp. KMM 6892]MEC4716530.1 Hpt domain-containing protein [Cocleimonas sp. KMM 6895]MEC4746315.1 Hpt domain-containing protein [Cocleimonas sp. KMM 6896]